MNVYN